jgi:hypothetical protein
MGASAVNSIVIGKVDSTGVTIDTVYAKVVPLYAVYRTAERVVVQYADDDALGSEQRRALIESNPLKGEINGLIDGWRKSDYEQQKLRARLFDRRVADALVVALQGDGANAVGLLTETKRDIVAERTSIARTSYLFTSCAATTLLFLIFSAFYLPQAATRTADSFFDSMCLSAAVGALGAFFSIAIAIRGRQIGTDLQWRDNHADAALRVAIGSISGVVLFWLLHTKIVTLGFGGASFGEGDSTTSLDVKRCLVLVTAFAAGFTERLVGDLLGQAAFGNPASAANPLAGAVRAAATVATTGKIAATETNPLGNPPVSAGRAVATEPEPSADDLIDGCLDHVALNPDERTRDVELPEASGGVASRA